MGRIDWIRACEWSLEDPSPFHENRAGMTLMSIARNSVEMQIFDNKRFAKQGPP